VAQSRDSIILYTLQITIFIMASSRNGNKRKTPENSRDEEVEVIDNYIHGAFVPPRSSSSYLDVTNPATGDVIGRVALSDAEDVNDAVESAAKAFPAWSTQWTMKARAAVILKFHALVQEHSHDLAECIVRENGKNMAEALADVAKGNETVEYAASIPNGALGAGRILPVSSGSIVCQDSRLPLGVVVSIVPFNFPFMVPMWTVPIALVLGNVVVLKPSEKVPLTLRRTLALWERAGLPAGCLNLLQGGRAAVEALIAHPKVQAVTFVGSSPVAAAVAQQSAGHKRCLALGGAKNHLVALGDCDIPSTAQDVVTSFCGCAGQRCMAASVLLLVPSSSDGRAEEEDAPRRLLLDTIVEMAGSLTAGTDAGQVGPVIDAASYEKIVSYIALAEHDGAQVLLDGRTWPRHRGGGGNWIGPTILLHQSATDRTIREEVFGPVLSVYRCHSWEEAMQMENASPFGNAAAIYTTSGGNAQWFLSRFQAAMLGCNIGIPVPREPFSFGGRYGTQSKYGSYTGDITGDGAIEFLTHRIKITSKWPDVNVPTVATSNGAARGPSTTRAAAEAPDRVDHASFAGRM
jgi:malonate-semialdehyde dehydrogenase (acetylating) / methylmalonate-semialdehyde dehydrogenase